MSEHDLSSEYVTLIEDCTNRSDRLTEWEATFLDSIETQIATGRRPTPKQIETLDTIWARATAKG